MSKSSGKALYPKLTREVLDKHLEDLINELPPQRHAFYYYCLTERRLVDGGNPFHILCKKKGCLCVDLRQACADYKIDLIMSLVSQMKEQLALIETNATAFNEKGNKAAGVRARKAALEMKGLCHELRKAITAKNNASK